MTSRKHTRTFWSRIGRDNPLIIIVIFFLILTFLAAVLWRNQLGGFFWQAVAPLLHARNALGVSNTQRLQDALASSVAMLADRDLLYQENLQLKMRLGRSAGMQTILAGVLMRPPATPYDTLMIDAGSQQGVVVDDLVSAGGTTLIGRVAQVYKTTARVILFSAPGQTYSALLSIQNGALSVPVEVKGQGAGSLEAQVPAKTPVAVGDSVVFPGIVGGFSSIVSYVDTKDGESFKTLYMHLPVNPLALRYVEVWRQKDATQ